MSEDPCRAAAAQLVRIAGMNLDAIPHLLPTLALIVVRYHASVRESKSATSATDFARLVDKLADQLDGIEATKAEIRGARFGIARSHADLWEIATYLNGVVVEALHVDRRHFCPIEWDEDAWQDPVPRAHAKMAAQIRAAATGCGLRELPTITRPRDAALEQFVGDLAQQYARVTGRRASASKASDRGYLPPFMLVLRALWPAVSDQLPPSTVTVGAVLSRLPAITPENHKQ